MKIFTGGASSLRVTSSYSPFIHSTPRGARASWCIHSNPRITPLRLGPATSQATSITVPWTVGSAQTRGWIFTSIARGKKEDKKRRKLFQ